VCEGRCKSAPFYRLEGGEGAVRLINAGTES
jgi:hypothetical protein